MGRNEKRKIKKEKKRRVLKTFHVFIYFQLPGKAVLRKVFQTKQVEVKKKAAPPEEP